MGGRSRRAARPAGSISGVEDSTSRLYPIGDAGGDLHGDDAARVVTDEIEHLQAQGVDRGDDAVGVALDGGAAGECIGRSHPRQVDGDRPAMPTEERQHLGELVATTAASGAAARPAAPAPSSARCTCPNGTST